MSLHLGDGVLSDWKLAPILDGIDEDASLVKVLDGGTNGRGFGDGVDGGGKEHASSKLLPQIFNGLVSVPGAVEILQVAVEVVSSDGSVGGVQVLE